MSRRPPTWSSRNNSSADVELSRNNSSADVAAMGQQQLSAPPGGMGNALAPPPPGSNKFAGGIGKRRGASGRVDVFKQSQSSPSLATTAAALPMIPPPGPMMTPMSIPPQPEEAAADQST